MEEYHKSLTPGKEVGEWIHTYSTNSNFNQPKHNAEISYECVPKNVFQNILKY